MKSLAFRLLVGMVFCSVVGAVTAADTLIYNNATATGYTFPPGSYTEIFDYGTSLGGQVSKFTFGYSSTSVISAVTVKFYQNISTYYHETGYLIKSITLNNLPSTGGGVQYYTYTLPEADRFTLPMNGQFGYSFIWASSSASLVLASGGTGNVNELWEYANDPYWGWGWYPFGFGSTSWAGLYMKIYTGPPLSAITCNIQGYKFNDVNGNGVWDAGEAALSGWDIYLDTNSNNVYDAGVDPNAVTDPNGFYRFQYLPSPATYTIREVQQGGWTQTLPGSGSGYEYTVATDPNQTYGPYNFGNTEGTPMKYGGGEGTVQSPYQIWNAQQMNQIGLNQEDWNKHFILMADIDMSGITGEQYHIIGYYISSSDYKSFTGTFDGNHHVIRNFSYVTASAKKAVGLIGYAEYAQVKDLSLENAILSSAGDGIGGLVGVQNFGTIQNCHGIVDVTGYRNVGGLFGIAGGVVDQCSAAGNVRGIYQTQVIGGLAGMLRDVTLTDCFSTVSVAGAAETHYIGGLAGRQYKGTTTDCYFAGTVATGNKSFFVGGLAGDLFSGSIFRSRNTASVTVEAETRCVGGLVGISFNGEIKSCFSTGEVSAPGSLYVGGLIGSNSAIISHCYSTGDVVVNGQSNYVGGLAGVSGGEIYCSYSRGSILGAAGGNIIGGLTGLSFGTVNSFWDAQTSGLTYSGGGKGRTTSRMKQASNYMNWNTAFETHWVLQEGVDYPHLAWEGTAGTALPTCLITDFMEGQGTSAEPFQIDNANDLNIIGLFSDQWDKEYSVEAGIDMSVLSGNEFNIIGTINIPFSGTFDGNGFWIDRFSYISLGFEGNVGLFRAVSGAVRDVNLGDMTISLAGSTTVGGLAANVTDTATIENCYVGGTLLGGYGAGEVGGLAGASAGSISNCDCDVDVTGGDDAYDVGGLAGIVLSGGMVSNSSSTGTIICGNRSLRIGGLAGELNGTAAGSYSTGHVIAGNTCQSLGGLVGYSGPSSLISNSYSKTNVSGGASCERLGGLVGGTTGNIYYSYSMGAVSAGEYGSFLGGLVGYASGSIVSDSYWDKQTSGLATSTKGTGLNTAQMYLAASYAYWDFSSIWRICEGTNYPRLQWEPKLPGDFGCPDGVELGDLMILTEEWLGEVFLPSADIAPEGGDGRIDLQDWARFAAAWMSTVGQPNWDAACNLSMSPVEVIDEYDLAVFADQWLSRTARYADIAPEGEPDGIVNLLDYAALAENWLAGTDP